MLVGFYRILSDVPVGGFEGPLLVLLRYYSPYREPTDQQLHLIASNGIIHNVTRASSF
jgi:hypothetical protein